MVKLDGSVGLCALKDIEIAVRIINESKEFNESSPEVVTAITAVTYWLHHERTIDATIALKKVRATIYGWRVGWQAAGETMSIAANKLLYILSDKIK